ncbi:MAG: hypothetical protein ACOZBH_01065 [Patescibacteria group bacterium]
MAKKIMIVSARSKKEAAKSGRRAARASGAIFHRPTKSHQPKKQKYVRSKTKAAIRKEWSV